jgi:putative ribosome biogenesis GTPase RsgA
MSVITEHYFITSVYVFNHCLFKDCVSNADQKCRMGERWANDKLEMMYNDGPVTLFHVYPEILVDLLRST